MWSEEKSQQIRLGKEDKSNKKKKKLKMKRQREDVTLTRDYIWMFTSFAECHEDYVIHHLTKAGTKKFSKAQSNKPTLMMKRKLQSTAFV